MSRWSGERVTAWLSPRGIVLARKPWYRRAADDEVRAFELGNDDSRGGAVLLEVLCGALRELGPAGSLDVVLSDQYVRYAVIPWSDDLSGEQEWTAYARHALTTTYGDVVRDWTIGLGSPLAGTPRLAVGADASLLAGLREAAARASLRLAHVTPNFCRAFDRHRRGLREKDLWFVTIEPGRLCAGRVCGGSCVRMERVRTRDGAAQTLAMLLRESSLAQDDVPGSQPVAVYWAGATPPQGVPGHRGVLRVLSRHAEVPAAAWSLGFA